MGETELMTFRIDKELKRKYQFVVGNMSKNLTEHILNVVQDYDDVEMAERREKMALVAYEEARKNKEVILQATLKSEAEHGEIQERMKKAVEECLAQFKRINWVSSVTVRKVAEEYKLKVKDLTLELNKHPEMDIRSPEEMER